MELVELADFVGQRHPVESVELMELVEPAKITGPETDGGTGGAC